MRRGGFCPLCYEEDTLYRVYTTDNLLAQQLERASERVAEVLNLDIPTEDPQAAKSLLGPLLRAVEIVLDRFKRPERAKVEGRVTHVHLINPPVDFRQPPRVVEGTGQCVPAEPPGVSAEPPSS